MKTKIINPQNNVKHNDSSIISRNIIATRLFQYLNAHNIVYAYLPACDNFSCTKEDINCVVSKKDFRRISESINEFCRQNNFIQVQKIKHETTACLFVLYCYNKHTENFIDVKINFYSDHKVKGRFYLAANELLSNRDYIVEENYWRVNNTHSFIFHLVNSIEKLSISEARFILLHKCWINATPTIQDELKRFFTKESITTLNECFNKNDIDHLKANLEYLNKSLRGKARTRLQDIIADKERILKDAVKPSGLVIGILGRDGCGKSTFVAEMVDSLGTYFEGTRTFKKFPMLLYKGEIFKKKEPHDNSKPHHYKERGSIASFIKLNVLLLEFLLGYWFKIFPLKAKSQLVLCDRYFIDILADPLRYRIKKNQFFIKLYHYILPKPDLWIILDLPSEVLLRRKQELTYEMAEHLRYKYLNLQKLLPNSIVINNEQEIAKTVSKASGFIFNYMHRKIA